MPRRSSADAALTTDASSSGQLLNTIRTLFQIACVVVFALALVLAYLKVEQFVITDSRFLLSGPPEPGTPSESFLVENAHFASEGQIAAVFSRDFGRSIYLCPIAERRRRLLAIDWVKDASVFRIWPNRLIVRIAERSPIAFVQIKRGNSMSYGLVDADGVLLDPKQAVKLNLPVLAGVPASDSREKRGERVKRFLTLQKDLGPMMDKISEVDVSDIENLKATQEIDGRAVTLLLGNQKFHDRMQAFLDNFEEIRSRLPDAALLDLRLKDRITVVGGEAPAVVPVNPARGSVRR